MELGDFDGPAGQADALQALRSASLPDEFWMYNYKILPCPHGYRHSWTHCPFSHSGETARRRCPRTHSYLPDPCPNARAKRQCPNGDACPYAHNTFEQWLHPSRYRTRLCYLGVNCRRPTCFFAHSVEELRNVEEGEQTGCMPPPATSMCMSSSSPLPSSSGLPCYASGGSVSGGDICGNGGAVSVCGVSGEFAPLTPGSSVTAASPSVQPSVSSPVASAVHQAASAAVVSSASGSPIEPAMAKIQPVTPTYYVPTNLQQQLMFPQPPPPLQQAPAQQRVPRSQAPAAAPAPASRRCSDVDPRSRTPTPPPPQLTQGDSYGHPSLPPPQQQPYPHQPPPSHPQAQQQRPQFMAFGPMQLPPGAHHPPGMVPLSTMPMPLHLTPGLGPMQLPPGGGGGAGMHMAPMGAVYLHPHLLPHQPAPNAGNPHHVNPTHAPLSHVMGPVAPAGGAPPMSLPHGAVFHIAPYGTVGCYYQPQLQHAGGGAVNGGGSGNTGSGRMRSWSHPGEGISPFVAGGVASTVNGSTTATAGPSPVYSNGNGYNCYNDQPSPSWGPESSHRSATAVSRMPYSSASVPNVGSTRGGGAAAAAAAPAPRHMPAPTNRATAVVRRVSTSASTPVNATAAAAAAAAAAAMRYPEVTLPARMNGSDSSSGGGDSGDVTAVPSGVGSPPQCIGPIQVQLQVQEPSGNLMTSQSLTAPPPTPNMAHIAESDNSDASIDAPAAVLQGIDGAATVQPEAAAVPYAVLLQQLLVSSAATAGAGVEQLAALLATLSKGSCSAAAAATADSGGMYDADGSVDESDGSDADSLAERTSDPGPRGLGAVIRHMSSEFGSVTAATSRNSDPGEHAVPAAAAAAATANVQQMLLPLLQTVLTEGLASGQLKLIDGTVQIKGCANGKKKSASKDNSRTVSSANSATSLNRSADDVSPTRGSSSSFCVV